jgi:hypothetical protein
MRSGAVVYAVCFALLPCLPRAVAQTSTPEKAAYIETCADLIVGAKVSESILRPEYKVGDAWSYKNYQVASGRSNRTWTETVTAVDAVGVEMQRIDRVPPDNIERAPFIYRPGLGEGSIFPLVKGKRWRSDIVKDGSKIGENIYSIMGCEVIRTDAGEFATLKIKDDFNRGEETYHQVMWFSPTVRNIVKLVYLEKGKAVQVTELTSFALN